MSENGAVVVQVDNGVARITFSHPKSNSLPGTLLREIARTVESCGADEAVKVIVMQSAGAKAFCAGASFAELQSIADEESGKTFFMGFAVLILAMKNCPKLIITRVQGKAVGGGVGIVAASDYVVAHDSAALKLSELALGLGPFVIGPCVERKTGAAGFGAMSIDTDWRSASWGRENGLYSSLAASHDELDQKVDELATRLTKTNPEAMARLKTVLWEGTDDWDALLADRARTSGELALSEFTSAAIASFGR